MAVTAIKNIIGTVNEIAIAIASSVVEQSSATQKIARNVQRVDAGAREVLSNIDSVSVAVDDVGLLRQNVGRLNHVFDKVYTSYMIHNQQRTYAVLSLRSRTLRNKRRRSVERRESRLHHTQHQVSSPWARKARCSQAIQRLYH